MIYELAILAHADVIDDKIASFTKMISDVVKENNGDVLIQDDWGVRTFAQATKHGVTKGRYLYYIYNADTTCNVEINRRLGIDEKVIRSLFVKLGEDAKRESIVKAYKTPFSKKYHGSAAAPEAAATTGEEDFEDPEADKRKFSKRRSCWFTAKKITPSWKDPATYSWLISEFGKISPARVSGISRKYQRRITSEIKMARQLGIASYLSNRIAE